MDRLSSQDTGTVTGKDGEILDPPSKSGDIVPPVPSELLGRRPRLSMMNRATIIDLDRRNMDDDEEPDVLPNAPTPKRNREEINFPDGPDDQMEHLGDSKRMHMDSNVTIANQLFDPSTRRCVKGKEPTDIEMDQWAHQDSDKPKPE